MLNVRITKIIEKWFCIDAARYIRRTAGSTWELKVENADVFVQNPFFRKNADFFLKIKLNFQVPKKVKNSLS